MAKILIVEDDVELLPTICDWLQNEGHIVDTAVDAESALHFMRVYQYDAMVLDWGLPGMSGVEFCKKLRLMKDSTPILMLTGRKTIDEKEAGFDSGADDYLTKPFDIRELSFRLRALLRRPAEYVGTTVQIGDLVLDSNSHRVTLAGREVRLQHKEFQLLEFFARHPAKLFSAETLMDRLWSADSDSSPDVVRKHINKLRSKLDTEEAPSLIRTVHGVGYGLDVPRGSAES